MYTENFLRSLNAEIAMENLNSKWDILAIKIHALIIKNIRTVWSYWENSENSSDEFLSKLAWEITSWSIIPMKLLRLLPHSKNKVTMAWTTDWLLPFELMLSIIVLHFKNYQRIKSKWKKNIKLALVEKYHWISNIIERTLFHQNVDT